MLIIGVKWIVTGKSTRGVSEVLVMFCFFFLILVLATRVCSPYENSSKYTYYLVHFSALCYMSIKNVPCKSMF